MDGSVHLLMPRLLHLPNGGGINSCVRTMWEITVHPECIRESWSECHWANRHLPARRRREALSLGIHVTEGRSEPHLAAGQIPFLQFYPPCVCAHFPLPCAPAPEQKHATRCLHYSCGLQTGLFDPRPSHLHCYPHPFWSASVYPKIFPSTTFTQSLILQPAGISPCL